MIDVNAAGGSGQASHYDTVGIGAGPSNLSLAALFPALSPREIALFDAQPGPAWHSGLLHPGVRMQTGWVKDLVSMLDPTHPLSFLNYLVTTGRIYGLLGAGYETIPRLEYTQYLAWAAGQIPRLFYNTPIDQVSFDDGRLYCHSRGEIAASCDHLVLGMGTVPVVPDFCSDLDSDRLILADLLDQQMPQQMDPETPVIVVGSGQTSAECVGALLNRGCRNIKWVGRRTWYGPLEDSPTANDLYRPAYHEFFVNLPHEARRRLVGGQILTSDGITPGTLTGLYQANYEARLRYGNFPVTLMPGRNVVGARMVDGEAELRCVGVSGDEEALRSQYVVLAAGRRATPPPFDEELSELIEWDEHGEPVIERDFSIMWKHADHHKIFVLNRGRYVQGLIDSNLSILPIRSAILINSLAERTVFKFQDQYVSTTWA
ncbi:MAG: SidA/IucD/PvdA family monooxygenase [Micromonosporaceae bacterium]